MSNVMPPPPPPPPPPAPPGGRAVAQFDFGKPFTYLFEDPRWLEKVLIGGLFYLASFLIIGWFFIMGYAARVTRNVIEGRPQPLPEWEDLGDMFAEGLRLVAVGVVYALPMIFIVLLVMIPAGVLSNLQNEGMQALSGGVAGCAWCLMVPLSLLVMFFMPASLLFAIVERRFGAAFDFSRVWPFIQANIGNYLLAIVVYLIARFLAGFGIALLCIGVIFTAFWSVLITAHAFGQVYRLAERR